MEFDPTATVDIPRLIPENRLVFASAPIPQLGGAQSDEGIEIFGRPEGVHPEATRRGLRIWREICWRAGSRCATLYCGPVLRHSAGAIQAANFRSAIAF